ncbi:hypothetical protein ACHAWX_002668 [Stephanocyclus meneghinianus]
MEAQTRRVKRNRVTDDDPKPAEAARSPLEESAVALAGVEGAMSASNNSKRNAPSSSPAGKRKIAKKNFIQKDRSESIDQLISVAGSLLKESTATAAAIAESKSAATSKPSDETLSSLPLVPNPIMLQQESTAIIFANAPAPPATTPADSAVAPNPPSTKASNKKSTISESNKKTQVQYNPDVPMTKEQLTAWRREMRRVRNRESAAASRRKVRDRIEELEEEVDVWKKRYEEAMERLSRAEARKKEEGKSEE